MLYLYQERHPAVLKRITGAIAQIIPNFDRFILEPSAMNRDLIELEWRQLGSDYPFGAHQLSDGSLRYIALATLLMQPRGSLPLLIALDETEIGLHPAALTLLASMLKSTSDECQLGISTQSSTLLNEFNQADLIISVSHGGHTAFERMNGNELESWLDDFTLGQLWERNIIHAGPYG